MNRSAFEQTPIPTHTFDYSATANDWVQQVDAICVDSRNEPDRQLDRLLSAANSGGGGTPMVSDKSDDERLIKAVQGGDVAAFGQLYERHVAAAYNVARRLSKSGADADCFVAEAFTRVLVVLLKRRGPESHFRAYLLTALRHVAYDKIRRDYKARLTDDVTTMAGIRIEAISQPFRDTAVANLEKTLVAEAFARLPERWQAVLWHTEIEGKSPAETAPSLGLTPNGVAALAFRAREGLREAYLQAHLPEITTGRCRATTCRLGAWTRHRLSTRETAQVEEHLTECEGCQALANELVDASNRLASRDATQFLATVPSHATTARHQSRRGVRSPIPSAPRSRHSWPTCTRATSSGPAPVQPC